MTQLPTAAARLFRGWWVVSGAMALQGLQAALFFQAFGVYVPFWMADFGWSRTTVSLIHSLHRTESGLLGPLHGWLLQRYGPQRVVVAGTLLLGSGFVALGLVNGFAQFLAVFLVMAIGSSLCGFMSLMTVVVNWFHRKRARAMALVGLGMSLGGLLVPLVAWTLVTLGWRPVAIGSGLIFLVFSLPLGRLLLSDPESLGLHPDGVARAVPDSASQGAATAKRIPDGARIDSPYAAIRTREFWLMSLGHSNALAIVSAVTVHFVVYVRDTLGLSVTTAAALLTIITVCQMVGQATGGFLGDRFDKRWLAGGGMLMHTVAMAILIWAATPAAVVAAAVLHGLAWGLRGPLMSALRADYFGRKVFAMVMGYSSLIIMIGSVTGPLVVGIVADRTGGYGPAFAVLAAIGAIGTAAFLLLRPAPDQAAH